METTQRRGRPATGRNSTTIRVPLDYNPELSRKLRYEVLPILQYYSTLIPEDRTLPRWEKLAKLIQEIEAIAPEVFEEEIDS